MPGFVKTKSDEKKWSKAKDAAAKQTERGSEGFWKLSNYIFHKSEGNHQVAEFFKSELMKFGGMGQLSLAEPESKCEGEHPRQPSMQKLSDFMAKCKLKKCGP
jgi:hypothetical protein